ncbi:MAG: hypothetical protein ACLGH8_02090 [Bacteroidia bacterium]
MKKVFGILSLFFAALNILVGLIGLNTQYKQEALVKISFGIGLLVLGAWLINSSKPNKNLPTKK